MGSGAEARFADFVPAISGARVLVVGDVMLDRYWFGDVHRISPEAPVPVVKVARTEDRPGGAANVARNAHALGAQVTLLSVIGEDEAGQALERLLADSGIRASLHRDAAAPTTVKLRVVGRQQQLLRIDFETSPGHEVLATKLAEFGSLIAAHDVAILSDYGKGGLAHIRHMIDAARALGRRVLVDPKGEDYERYAGATLLTPNRSEFRQVAGGWTDEPTLTAKAQSLRRTLALEALLVTRSEEGMTLYTDERRDHIPADAREVYDVSGAGDTVIAALGVLLAAGADMLAATRIANQAAGVVVGKLGTAVVHQHELLARDDAGAG
jgi:rfaE bifunctional protein kinase chain/domain